MPFYFDDVDPIDPSTIDLTKATKAQLERVANWYLQKDANENPERVGSGWGTDEAPVLHDQQIRARRQREVLVESGVPDPSLTVNSNGERGSFNRIEPHGGRSVSTADSRSKHGSSFYGQGTMGEPKAKKNEAEN